MELDQKVDQFKGQARLPDFVVPKCYELTIKPDLSACDFSGIVLIHISIHRPTRFLVLNALELVITHVSFTNSQNLKYVPSDILVDNDDEILVLVFDETILDVGNGVLEIGFSGVLDENCRGLYRCTYLDKGEKKNMIATQFEAVHARRCFPCWDEPAFKATFKIMLENVPSELTALSNMPILDEKINGPLKTVQFEESVIMSTYLVAIVVGLFDYVEDMTDDGTKVRSYCPVGQSEKGKLALSIAVKTLDLFGIYFSMPYPLTKLDMVAVPEFSGGAMENNGLITFREAELLKDELHSAAAEIRRLTIIVAHEVAHHWFGNLVTMEWWTHLWLNEGFATWVSYLATDRLFPEWKIWNQFLQETVDGLHMDALEQSHPIEVEIPRAQSVDEYFDDISYEKGSSVIRMLQNFLGDDIFQKSLASYMTRYAFKNAKTEDLWDVLSETSGVEVNTMMNMWTKKKGYPVITVKLNGYTLEFEQTQFLYSALDSDAQWIVPLTLSIGSYDVQKKFLLETKHGKLGLEDLFCSSDKTNTLNYSEETWWIKLNVHQGGFYRVKYENNLATRLRQAVATNCLSAADEFGFLDDTFALCQACMTPFSYLLSLMDTYRKEREYVVLSRLIKVSYSAVKIIQDAIPGLANDLKLFFANLLRSSVKLGWDATPGESRLNSLIREEVLMALAQFGHRQTHEEAMKRFHAFLHDRNTSLLPVDTRKAAYVSVMRNASIGDRSGWESLLRLYRDVDSVLEKTRILRCMGSCSDPTIVSEVLDLMLSDEFRNQDAIYILLGISWEGRDIAWMWLKENWDLIMKKWGGGMLITHFVRDIVTPFCSVEMADEVETFFKNHGVPSVDMNLKQSLELVRIKARWMEHIKQEQDILKELVKELARK
ncbi:aminopeptidase M1-like [Henckelia pumila]|uniref:aminopeptidase M1-like n=1 Tax=Henckelia pumila TaxID=405737 RepID=UPI003C6E9ED6